MLRTRHAIFLPFPSSQRTPKRIALCWRMDLCWCWVMLNMVEVRPQFPLISVRSAAFTWLTGFAKGTLRLREFHWAMCIFCKVHHPLYCRLIYPTTSDFTAPPSDFTPLPHSPTLQWMSHRRWVLDSSDFSNFELAMCMGCSLCSKDICAKRPLEYSPNPICIRFHLCTIGLLKLKRHWAQNHFYINNKYCLKVHFAVDSLPPMFFSA